MSLPSLNMMPGMYAAVENVEKEIAWGRYEHFLLSNQRSIVSSAVDAGNTPTTVLRAGLLLGKVTTTGKLIQWDPTATDGSEVVEGILLRDVSMLNPLTQSAVDQAAHVAQGGPVKADQLLILGTAFNSSTYEGVARAQLRSRFILDDDLIGRPGFGAPWCREIAKTADYTVTEADAGTLFTTVGASGAVIFTLPAIRAGLGPFEFLNMVDQNMTIASAGSSDNIVWDNDASVDTLAFSTASHKIGGRLRFRVNAAGTKWYVENLSPATCTVTAA